MAHSFVEWRHVIGPLTDPARYGGDPADAFDVVAPSLPGFGFSSQPSRPDFTVRDTAAAWIELMAALGCQRFAAHGCDWGSYVTAAMGHDFPDHLVGIHMGALNARGTRPVREPSAEEAEFDARSRRWREREHGYQVIQATKPQSVAFGLNDSPAGLAAWIAEKWRAWSDCAGVPASAIEVADLLTNICVYWFSGTIGSASRIYAVNPQHALELAPGERIAPPAGFIFQDARSASDRRTFLDVPRAGAPPRTRAEEIFDIRSWTVLKPGGHFPALEVPETFVDDLRAFFRPLRTGSHLV